jgi:hypothetical protein
MQTCIHLEPLFELINSEKKIEYVASTGWTKMKLVLQFKQPVPRKFCFDLLSVESPLKYYAFKGSPHDKPDEGVVCEECKISISFPITST